MDKIIEFLEFIYYSVIIFIIIIFLTILIDIISVKIFPQGYHSYIIVDIFITWILISIIVFYSKKLVYMLPFPFSESSLQNQDEHSIMIIMLIPVIVACSVKNIRNKTQYLYSNIEKYF